MQINSPQAISLSCDGGRRYGRRRIRENRIGEIWVYGVEGVLSTALKQL